MEVASATTKRSAEPDQSDDTFAVCTQCSRLSANLRVCDKCGSTLSDDNSALCYSVEPKRPCLESAALANRTVSTPSTSSTTLSSSNDAAVLASSSATTTTAMSDSPVRPQALYVNVNNQAFPVLGVSPAPSSTAAVTVPRPANVVSTALHHNVSVAGPTHLPTVPVLSRPAAVLNSTSRPVPSGVATVPGAAGAVVRPTNINGTAATATSTQVITLPTYNLQPPPPPFASSVARLPGIVSGSAQASIVSAAGMAPTAPSLQTVLVSAVQIRIGVKKFKPLSAVTFKDDGILFTLKDYTYAPVLLNARAILKCKANLSTFSYPVLFLFLESSCMRQIRNIFGLTSSDFCPTSPVEMKRCISIFPVFCSEGRSQAQSVMYSIKRSFEAMVRRYPRSSNILEEITNDQAIDMLLDLNSGRDSGTDGSETAASADSTASPSVSMAVPTATVHHTVASTPVTTSGTQAMLAQAQGQAQHSAVNGSVPAVVSSSSISQCSGTPAVSTAVVNRSSIAAQLNRAQATAPVLQIPSDQARWQMMQKGLIAGGVYHVLMPDGGRQYCLWNGKQLVPCLVQNTEVQLQCVRVRIGSLLAQCVGQVRVRADQNSGIFFTIKSDHTGTQEIYIPPDEIATCHVCFTNVAVVFITLNNVGADKLRKRLRLNSVIDPAYDPAGTAVFRRYILLFLSSVNRDQEDALKQMKRSGSSSPMFSTVDVSKGLFTLAQIKLDNTNPSVIGEYLRSKHLTGILGFERLVNEVSSSTSGGSAVADDDDDDVIMTQEEVGMKCPYTQQVMKWPVCNKICGHNYERDAIQEFIQRKKGNAKCPYAGCANLVPLRMEDLTENTQLREHIKKQEAAGQS